MTKSERKIIKIKRMVRTLGFNDRVELMDWLNAWYGEEKRLADLEFQEMYQQISHYPSYSTGMATHSI